MACAVAAAAAAGPPASAARPKTADASTAPAAKHALERDIRDGRNVAPRRDAVAAATALKQQLPRLSVSWSPRYGTVALLTSDSGRLAPPVAGPAAAVARAWLAAHRELFALPANAELALTRDAELAGTGVRALVFRQTYDGLRTFAGGTIGVNVARDGAIVTVWSDAGPGGHVDRTPRVASSSAAETVARAVGAADSRKGSTRLAVFPLATGPRLAWRVYLVKADDEVYTAAVDARDGALLYLHSRVKHAEGLVFRNHPGAAKGGAQERVSFDGDPSASPAGWLGPAPVTTAGNNVVAFNDFLGVARTPPNKAPVAPTGDFDFPYQGAWERDCTPVIGEDGIATVENPSYLQDVDASTTNVFYLANIYHDLTYKLGFTEAMGNFQLDNFERGGRGGDPIEAASMSGIATGGVSNAYFIPSPDGGEPISANGDLNTGSRMAMFLFRPIGLYEAACADSSLDAHIVWHELTHGLTTRLAGGPDDADSLSRPQSGSMGEGWGDWFALHLLHQLGLEDGTAIGAWVTGNAETGVRNFNVSASPLTYGDFGYGFSGPEVHDDGEIWLATLWDLRTALIARHGAVEGANRAGHLVFDALVLAGLPNPTFLQQRDGVLQADRLRYAGTDIDLIWQAFAKRGMGVSASTSGPDDVEPHPAFDRPGTQSAIRGIARDADTGTRLAGVVVSIGFGEGGAAPAATSGADGAFSIAAAPGRYRLTYRASGYGLRHAEIDVGPGGASVDVKLPKNLASVSYGAKATGGALPEHAGVSLLDDDETTGPVVALGQPVTVRLGGTDAVDVTSVQVAVRFNGTAVPPPQGFRVELSGDGERWDVVHTRDIPRRRPIPVVPDVAVVEARLPSPVKAKFARLTATASIVPAVEGEPTLASVTELQVFGAAPSLAPARVDVDSVVEQASIDNPLALGLVTPTVFEARCAKPAEPIQGDDAWVTDLRRAGDGSHRLRLDPHGAEVDLDVTFYDASCAVLGSLATPAGDETGPVPPGAAWAVTTLYSGTSPVNFDVHLASTVKPVRLAAAAPPATGRLPATGTDHRFLAIAMCAAALMLVWRFRHRRSLSTSIAKAR